MKSIITLILFYFFVSQAYCGDFRGVNWGMSLDQVKNIEKADYKNEELHPKQKEIYWLDYEVEIRGVTYLLRYNFVNKLLNGASVSNIFPRSSQKCGKSISDFVKWLNQTLGEPSADSEYEMDLEAGSKVTFPEGFNVALESCESLAQLKYGREARWEGRSNAYMLIMNDNEPDKAVYFSLIIFQNATPKNDK